MTDDGDRDREAVLAAAKAEVHELLDDLVAPSTARPRLAEPSEEAISAVEAIEEAPHGGRSDREITRGALRAAYSIDGEAVSVRARAARDRKHDLWLEGVLRNVLRIIERDERRAHLE